MVHLIQSFRLLAVRSMAASALFIALVLLAPSTARSQFPPAAGTRVRDASALKPPAGANVAIVEFEDMQCPQCGRLNPLLKAAAAQYKIPLTRHDFPLAMHNWSLIAAINSRWFDTKGKKIGDEYRDEIFANQASIFNPITLRQFTEKFAREHNLTLPFSIDPQGTLAAQVKADQTLGERIGIDHTPTIWIVTAHSTGSPYIEVVDSNRLYEAIDQAMAETRAAPSPTKKSKSKK